MLLTFDEVRDLASSFPEEREIREASEHVLGVLESVALRENLSDRPVNYGSSNEGRLTFVVGHSSDSIAHPPDVDIKLGLTTEEIRAGLVESVFEPFVSTKRISRRRGQFTAQFSLGKVPVFLKVYEKDVQENNRPHYGEPEFRLTVDQVRDVRALKLLLQWYGSYGEFNNGFSGFAAEQSVRVYGDLEGAVAFLGAASKKREQRRVLRPGEDDNLIGRVSRYVWSRVSRLVDDYNKTGTVSSDFGVSSWRRLKGHPISMDAAILCCPLSCGTEAYEIALESCKAVASSLEQKQPVDYYVVPVIDSRGIPRTEIYLAFPHQEGTSPREIANAVRDKLYSFQER